MRATDDDRPQSRIMVGFDGSPAAVAALRQADTIAERCEAVVEVILLPAGRGLARAFAASAGLHANEIDRADRAELEEGVRLALTSPAHGATPSRRIGSGQGWRFLERRGASACRLIVLPSVSLLSLRRRRSVQQLGKHTPVLLVPSREPDSTSL